MGTQITEFKNQISTLPNILVPCLFTAVFTWVFGVISFILQEPHQDAIITGYLGIGLTIVLILLIILLFFILPDKIERKPRIIGGLFGFTIWLFGTGLTLLSAYETIFLGFLFESPTSFQAHATEPIFYLKLVIAPIIFLSALVGNFLFGVITEKITIDSFDNNE